MKNYKKYKLNSFLHKQPKRKCAMKMPLVVATLHGAALQSVLVGVFLLLFLSSSRVITRRYTEFRISIDRIYGKALASGLAPIPSSYPFGLEK